MDYRANIKFYAAMLIALVLAACTTASTGTPTAPTDTSGTPVWTGRVVNYGYVHSLSKVVTTHKMMPADTVFMDTNLKDTTYNSLFSMIKLGYTFDSLSNGDKIYRTPQNGFVVFDLAKFFGGRISNIRTANLKIKLFQRSDYTSALKYFVSVMDTTILAKTVRERVAAVESSGGTGAGYLNEITLDVKGNITASGKLVIGIRAENPNQAFAAVDYCKIEFDGDIASPGSNTAR